MWQRLLTYFLDEQGEPVGVDLLTTWRDHDWRYFEWYEHSWEPGPRSRRIAEDFVDGYRVSTVFLMIDRQFGNGPPVLWETIIFDPQDGDSEHYCERYTSREAAAQGHARVVAALLAGKTPEQLNDYEHIRESKCQ